MMRSVKRRRSTFITIAVMGLVIAGVYFGAVKYKPVIEVGIQVRRLREFAPEEPNMRRIAEVKLLEAGVHAVQPCAGLAADTSVQEGSRELALDVLLQLGSTGVAADETVYGALSAIAYSPTDSLDLRIRALRELSKRKDPRLLGRLAAIAASPERDLRVEAISAASQFEGPETWKLLVGMLADKDSVVRGAAQSALVRTANEQETVACLGERLREVTPAEARSILSVISRIARHDFKLRPNWYRADFYGGLRRIEAELEELAYVLPADGTEMIEHEIRSSVPRQFRFAAIQKAAGKVVVTLVQAGRGDEARLLADAADLAARWEELPAIKTAEAPERHQFMTDERGRTKAHFFMLIDLAEAP